MSQDSDKPVHTFCRAVAPVNSQGEVVCYHEERAQLRTSHTSINPDRDFFVCEKEKDDPKNCGFFVWADNHRVCAARESTRRHMNTMANTQAATPRRPSQAQRAQMARSPDTPISPQKRRRAPSPPPPFLPSAGHPLTPKQRRLNGFASTPESIAQRKAAIAVALKPPSQGSEARIKSIADELAAVAREQQMTHPGNQQPPHTPTASSGSPRKDVQGSQSQSRSDRSSTTAPPPPATSPSPAARNAIPMHGLGLPVLRSSGSRQPSSPGTQSEAAFSITDEVHQADMEDDEIEDAVWVDPEHDLEDKQIQTDPIEDDSDFDENGMWSSQPSRAAMSSPTSSIPFTLPATRMTVDDDDEVYFGSGASASRATQWREPGLVAGSSPARPPPQTPSSGRAGSSRAFASGGNASQVNSGARNTTSSLLTPPGSLQRDHQHSEDGASSSMSRRDRDTGIIGPLLRGSQRQGQGLDESPSPSPESARRRERSQWQMIQDDPENPFHERAAALRADSRTQASSTGNAVLGAESAGLSDPLSADRIEQQLASLAGLPEYIRKLERRERAAQKSAETKAKKIVRLEEELQRLWNTNRMLEETVAALEARR